MTGWLSANGKTLVASQTTPSFHPSVLLGIKQEQSNFSNADLIGIYKVVSFASYSLSDYRDTSNLSTLTFDGAGNFSGTDLQNKGGTIAFPRVISGAYTVAEDGTLTITGDLTITGGLSADGN